ncbi:unnamed protein product [Notodromas monacha]|uniref:Mediator of RNA polymerase II transcription subunit 18 n=1 Tax=Notodromas monacha TaxID=399045 RepID=A0A7R9BP75_9CRUS|nr:unnamed protein product [Notodromas monacha]CAG0919107.1 unnamed protein product [Notodromas monacha]
MYVGTERDPPAIGENWCLKRVRAVKEKLKAKSNSLQSDAEWLLDRLSQSSRIGFLLHYSTSRNDFSIADWENSHKKLLAIKETVEEMQFTFKKMLQSLDMLEKRMERLEEWKNEPAAEALSFDEFVASCNACEVRQPGSVVDSSRDVLIHRLQGLCDSVAGGPEFFHEHEMVYTLYPPMASNSGIPSAGQPLSMRIRRALSGGSIDPNNTPWILRYVGNPEMGDQKRATVIRNCIDVPCSQNIGEFLRELGFQVEYEYVAKGHMFRKGRMKITVAKQYRMLTTQNKNPPETTFEPISGSHLVELSVATSRAHTVESVLGEDMRAFAEQLKPLVHLGKIDPRRAP